MERKIDETYVPREVVRRLKREAIRFEFCHKIKEFDDYYAIVYDSRRHHFVVEIRSSVWDGRGHEQERLFLSEGDLSARFDAILEEGQTLWALFRPLERLPSEQPSNEGADSHKEGGDPGEEPDPEGGDTVS